jgi:osmotically-inducible protein OsmY
MVSLVNKEGTDKNLVVESAMDGPFADRDLERRVINYLAGRHVPSLRHLAVQASNGTVTLAGSVRSFYEKQLCQHCCQRVVGVVRLVDKISVVHTQPAVAAFA